MPTETKSSAAARFEIGTSSPRFEDLRLVRGAGRFVDDFAEPGAAHMAILRSPHAAAKIQSIATDAARAMPGVLAVLTGVDLEADGIGLLHASVKRKLRDGSPMPEPPFRMLALDYVHFAGEGVAIVIAETLVQAQDAAEQVQVDYDALPSVTDASDAVRPGAPAVWPDHAPDNVCFVFEAGDRQAVDLAFAGAHHVARLDFRITRVSANALEPRNALARYDVASESYTLITGTQAPHTVRWELAERALKIPPGRLRVISPDVGGAFGMKGSPYPEQALALWAARRTGRPVRWTATRVESFLSDFHARDNVSTVELALDRNGIFLALRIHTLANLGAYLGFSTPHPSTNNLGGLAGTYRTPHICAEVTALFTNTQPIAPYRGAGRPEATYALERVIDVAASELGLDRVEIRRRNLIPASAMPFRTGLVFTYDCGEFERNMDMALAAADWAGFSDRRAAADERGLLLGVGVANAIEIAAGPFRKPNEEAAEIRFDAAGDATIVLGSHNHGQGHETAFRQIVASQLGLPPERIRVLFGDTDLIPHGRGTFGSRSMTAGGAAVVLAAKRLIQRGRSLAAHQLETSEKDVQFENGQFRVIGTDRTVSIGDVARLSYQVGALPPGVDYGFFERAIATPNEANFPNGCHVCEVEIDPQTGIARVVRYTVCDDVGTLINPMLVKGQLHGGVAQGLGQIFSERIVYGDSGQMLTASFMDYGMPRADDMPMIDVLSNPVPTLTNPLGVKGAGEAGAVGALSAVMNAVVDALSPYGVRHMDMPATPERVWATIQRAKKKLVSAREI